MIKFSIREMSSAIQLQRKFQRALRTFSDFTPEMDLTGRWVCRDGGKRLAARGSKVSLTRLARSLTHKAYKMVAVITSTLPYARIQQEGGTIRPRRRPYMAIPLKLDLQRKHVWPKHLKKGDLICIKSKAGNLILWNVKKKEPWFVLKKQVTIKGRPYLVKSPELIRYMRSLFARKLKRFARND